MVQELQKVADPYCITEGYATDTFIAKQIFENGKWMVVNRVFYVYREAKGCWESENKSRVLKFICINLRFFYSNKKTGKQYKYSSNNKLKGVFNCARKRLHQKNFEFSQEHIAFQNGTLNMRDKSFTPHCKEHYAERYLDCIYQEGCECPPNFLAFLNSSFGEDKVSLLQALILMYISPDVSYGKFGYLTNGSGERRDVFIRLIKKILGTRLAKALSFTDIKSDRNRHLYLKNTSLFVNAYFGGFRSRLQASCFCQLVDNTPMTGRALYNHDTYQKNWNVRFLLASEPPHEIKLGREEFFSRAIHIPTKGASLEILDRDLEGNLESEIPQIVSWVLGMKTKEAEEILFNHQNQEES